MVKNHAENIPTEAQGKRHSFEKPPIRLKKKPYTPVFPTANTLAYELRRK